jgi:hypothetical protein
MTHPDPQAAPPETDLRDEEEQLCAAIEAPAPPGPPGRAPGEGDGCDRRLVEFTGETRIIDALKAAVAAVLEETS